MKIAFDVSQTCVERTGCGWLADSLAHAIAAECSQTEDLLLLYHQFGDWINDDTTSGTLINRSCVKAPFYEMPSHEARKIWSKAVKNGKSLPGNPDIIHSNNFCAPSVAGSKLVYMVHDLAFFVHPEFATETNRLHCQNGLLNAIRNADAFIFNSEHTHSEFEMIFPGWLAEMQKPSRVIPLGCRHAQSPELTLVDKGHWLTVGSLEPRKNHLSILDAVEIYWIRSCQKRPLLIAGGSGWKSDHIKKRIQNMEVDGKVSYVGYVDDQKLQQLYQSAFGLVFASWHEGFGLPVLEAMSAGCPVIVSNRASLSEVGGEAPIYIDPSKPDQIAEAMLRLESEPTLPVILSEKSLRQASRYTWQNSAKATLDFYRMLMAK